MPSFFFSPLVFFELVGVGLGSALVVAALVSEVAALVGSALVSEVAALFSEVASADSSLFCIPSRGFILLK